MLDEVIMMEYKSKIRLTTWILGTSILYTATLCYVIFLANVNYGAGVISMLFAYLLPAVVVDPRKELRSMIGCIAWWVIALFVTSLFLQMNLILLISCLLTTISVSTLVFQIYNMAVQTGLNFRRNKGNMRVGNSAICIACYLAMVSLLFAIAWYIVADAKLLVVILAFQSFTGWCYVIYCWNWSIRIDEKSITIVRFSQEREFVAENIHAIRKIPFGYYLVINQKEQVVFGFSLRMERSSKLWMIIRSKVKQSSRTRTRDGSKSLKK